MAWLERIESSEYADRENPLELLAGLSDIVLAGDSYRAPDEFCNILDVR